MMRKFSLSGCLLRIILIIIIYLLIKQVAIYVYNTRLAPAPPPKPVYQVASGTIGPNGSLYTVFSKHLPTQNETWIAVANALSQVMDLRTMQPDHRYRIYIDDQNYFKKMVYEASSINVFMVIATANNYVAFQEPVFLKKRLSSLIMPLETTVYDAFISAGETPYLATMYADIFSWDIDFYLYPQKGDKMVLLYEKYYAPDGSFVKYGDLLAAKYLTPAGRQSFRAYRFYDQDGKDAYYDEVGDPVEKMFLKMPLHFGYLTSAFSRNRLHPIYNVRRPHTGIDYGSRYGAPIIGTADGIVIFAGWSGGYGKLVKIRHPNGYVTYYGHCSRLLVSPGQTITQGQVIARVGATGAATGPHVHYEIRDRRGPINPAGFNTVKGKPLTTEALTVFKQRVNNLNNLLANPPNYDLVGPEPEPENKILTFTKNVLKVGKMIFWF